MKRINDLLIHTQDNGILKDYQVESIFFGYRQGRTLQQKNWY
jgi:hypothetical protein